MEQSYLPYRCRVCGEWPPDQWSFEPPKDGGDLHSAADETVLVAGGNLGGPVWPRPEPWDGWYRICFTAQTESRAYCPARFLDAEGNELGSSVYGAVTPSASWSEQSYCFRGRWGATTWRVGFRFDGPARVRDIGVEAIDAETAARWGDELRKTLPEVTYQPPSDRCVRLPETMRRLAAGDPLRIVMLGDSLTHDTRNSNFDALLPRRYPRAAVQVVVSVRGSTGCWHYREPAHFQTYVADPRPDLLVIGCNPSHEKADAVRDVVARARADLGCEVALLFPPSGPDWRDADAARPDGSLPGCTWPGNPVYETLAAVANELEIECIDMATPWNHYLGRSGKPFGWFNRDRVHVSERGTQAAAVMLGRYFGV